MKTPQVLYFLTSHSKMNIISQWWSTNVPIKPFTRHIKTTSHLMNVILSQVNTFVVCNSTMFLVQFHVDNLRTLLICRASSKKKLLSTAVSTEGLSITVLLQWVKNLSSPIAPQDELYRVSHKKRNGGFSVACDLKVPYLFTSSNQATPAEENDTKIIKFEWVILIQWPFVIKNTVIFKFCLIFVTDERRIMLGMAFHCCISGKPIDAVSTKETRFNGIPQGIIMKGYSRHNSSLISRKNRAKFENDCISKNGHRIKTTQPNLMILVSFSSAEDV